MEEKENGVQVSIICTAYNHAKYIRQCLDGFVMQKGVSFEIIIHDDASTDGTADIIREYEAKYPQLFKPIYQTENQYSQHIPFPKLYMIPKVTGKYVALCEGDDFWTDEYKLKKQYDALEANPDCYMCLHRVEKVNEDGSLCGKYMPIVDNLPSKMTSEVFFHTLKNADEYHTSSFFMISAIYCDYIINPPIFRKVAPVGDFPMLLYFASNGGIYYYNEIMSNRRLNSIGSWTWRMNDPDHRKAIQMRKDFSKKIRMMIDEFNIYSNRKYTDDLQFYVELHQRTTKGWRIDEFFFLINNRDYKELFESFSEKELKEYGLSNKAMLKMKLTIHFPKLISFFFKR